MTKTKHTAKHLVVGDSSSDVYSRHRTRENAERAARALETRRRQYPHSPYFAAGAPRVVSGEWVLPPPSLKRGRKPQAGSKRNGGVIVTAIVSPEARALIARACAERGLTIGEVLTIGATVALGSSK